MALIERFISEIDSLWGREDPRRLDFDIIGSCALMLQAEYQRVTKDSDVLETRQMDGVVRKRLIDLAGWGSRLHKRHGIYLDIVQGSLPFLPQRPIFHPIAPLADLRSISARALDVVDVVVSKLKRFSANDRADIGAMVDRGSVPHAVLLERFRLAMDGFEVDARAQDFPKCIDNLHVVERDHLGVSETAIELPDWFA
ncbi:DUF6036 family nucleotidyltransferase [Elusimicrobiota bacterium]